ncbi:MAG: 3D domain-containing protein [Candidatus Omnitrophica bacterium]|nr:3D domain-containing protein [Candidatus Omnitrophota bacterium]
MYTVTAYCNCPICINVPAYRDGKFASGKKLYWGAVAADPSVPFGAKVELVPHSPLDLFDIFFLLRGRFNYRVEDRGGKIKGRDIDIYIPESLGGHKLALQWGRRHMRIKINGELAE